MGGEEAGLLPPAWTLGFTQRAWKGCLAALRGPGAPWPRTTQPGCGREGPSHPAALWGRGHHLPHCQSPES